MYSSITLKQFRSYSAKTFDFAPRVNIVVGKNGSGKTNLLEAIYVLSQGTSFRVSDKDLIQSAQDWFRLEGIYGEQQRSLTYRLTTLPAKQFNLDGVRKQRLSYQQRVPLVLFEPNELRLLHGAPQRRREYVDTLIGRLWYDSISRRGRFERTLLQRNNIIKQAQDRPLSVLEDELFVWDIKLSEYAAALVERRLELIANWNEQLSDIYSRIATTTSTVEAVYRSEVSLENYKASLLRHLTSRRHTDLARGFTSIGPHRDDVILLLNGVDASLAASRGEMRTLVLAIKIAELRLLDRISTSHPLLLLDDVFSELDSTRRQALAEQAQEFQTIITTTDADTALHYFADSRLITVPTE